MPAVVSIQRQVYIMQIPTIGISLCIIKLDIFVVFVLNILLHVRYLCVLAYTSHMKTNDESNTSQNYN